MKTPIYIRRIVGYCTICGAPLLDAGWTTSPMTWTHSMPRADGLVQCIKPTPNALGYPGCSMKVPAVQ